MKSYVEDLLPQLRNVVSSSQLSFDTIQIAISCYGSISVSMKKDLKPKFGEIIPLLINIINLEVKGGNQSAISEAMQSVGKICVNCMEIQEYEQFVKPVVEKIYNRMIQSQEP